ncbi:hypothetical protein G7054_g1254 [Neopestalotiopsis clavispora]|nr:hypothetical protein G7054_g1254 [Neopestalotiopsis clavispora]
MASYPISDNSWASKSQLLGTSVSRDPLGALGESPVADAQPNLEYLEPPSGQDDHFSSLLAGNEQQHELLSEPLGQLISRPIDSIEDISEGFSFTAFPSKSATPRTSTDKNLAAHSNTRHSIFNVEPPMQPSTLVPAPKSRTINVDSTFNEARCPERSPISRPTKGSSSRLEHPIVMVDDTIGPSLTSDLPQNDSRTNKPQAREVSHSSEGSKTTSRQSTSHADGTTMPPLERIIQTEGSTQVRNGNRMSVNNQQPHHDQGYNVLEHEHIDDPDFYHDALQTASRNHPRGRDAQRGMAMEQISPMKDHATQNEARQSREPIAPFAPPAPQLRQDAEVHDNIPRIHTRASSAATHRSQRSDHGSEAIDLPWQSHAPQSHRRRRARANQEHGTANRPLDKSRHGEPSLRPNSQNSNICKTRAPAKHHGRHASTARSVRHRDAIAPTQLQKAASRNHKTLVSSWNRYFNTHYEHQDALQTEIASLQEDLEECSGVIAQLEADAQEQAKEFQNQINSRSNTINKLRSESSELRTSLAQSESALMERDDKYEALAEKCRQYKECFNKAIAEHQQLYTKTKQNLKNIVAQIQEEFDAEKKDKDKIIHEILDRTESIRNSFRKQAELIDREAKHQFSTMASTIKTLKAELAERQRELVRERQDSKKIRDELEQARDENAQTLEDLSAQNNKILETITLHHQENQGSPGVSEEIERKLDSLCQSMSGLHQVMANPAALSEDVASLGRGITTQLATFFGDLGSRVSEIDCVQKQHSPIIDEIANACRAIDERMQSEDGVAYWQDKCQEADQNLRVLEQHTRRIQSEADVASRHNQDLSIANNKLATDVSSLREQVSSLEEKLQAAGNTAAAKDSNIKQALQTKDAEITELQSKLNHGKIDLEKLKQELQARDDEKVAVATAHQNEVDGLQRRCTDTENRLRATENARSGIEKELQIANDKIRDLSQENGAEQVIAFLKEEIRVLSEVAKEQKSIDTKLGDSAARLQAGDVRLAALAKQYDVLTRKYSEASKKNDGLAETRSQYIELYQKVSGLSISNEQADNQTLTHAPAVDMEEMARTRRVTVKSPIEGPILLAPSVEEERKRRRLSVPGKSNLRGTTRSTSSELVIPLKIKSSSSQANDLDGSTARSASSQPMIPLKIKNSSSQENDIEEQTFTGPELVDSSRTRAYFNRSSFNRPVRGGNQGNSAVTNSGEDERRRLSSSHATDVDRWVSGQDSANHPQDGNDSSAAPTHNTVLSPKNSTKRVLRRHDLDDVDGAEVRQHDASKSLPSSSQGKRQPRKASLLTYGNETQESLPVETASASSQPITPTSIAPAGTKRKRSASALR